MEDKISDNSSIRSPESFEPSVRYRFINFPKITKIGTDKKTIKFPSKDGHPMTIRPIITATINIMKGTIAAARARAPSTTRSPSAEIRFKISPAFKQL